ncbi:MAG TPA: 16S rRNA (guanine(966)-N(2))-methyltransferase RsmD [Solirubrobacteraceae bacterium]
MRVIAGSARGIRLRSPSSEGTRPISDRGKEALFSILMPRLPGASFLDLFAGVGGAGIEALSRGAAHATFVELSAKVVEDVRHNLGATRLADRADVVHGDAFDFLRREPRPYDVVFVAPPQWQGLWKRAVLALDERPGWVAPDGVIVAQHDPKEDEDLALSRFERVRSRAYGGVQFGFYEPVPYDLRPAGPVAP